MAEITPPLFMDTDNVYSGDELGLPYRDIIGEGVVGSGDLAVSQRAAGANLSVDVAAGACWVQGDDDVNAQPTYRCRSSSVVNLTITPDGANPLVVRVIAEVIDAGFAGLSRKWQLRAVHGTPAGSPVAPALPVNAISLATISVAAAASLVVNANITDARSRATVGGGSAVGVPTGAIFPYPVATAPAGYVLADGSTYDGTNAKYTSLWGVLGTTYGGTGQSSFAVPDLRGRTITGYASGGHVDVQTLGLNDGVVLANRRPKHRHTVTDPGHGHNVKIGTGNIGTAGDTVVQGNSPPSSLEVRAVSNTTGITVGAAADSLDAAPYLVLNYIIKL